MQYTTYYALNKPEAEDLVNIDDLNDNADTIDGQLHEQNLAIATLNNQTTIKAVSVTNNVLTVTYQDGTITKFDLATTTVDTISISVTTSADWEELTDTTQIKITDADDNIISQMTGTSLAEVEGLYTVKGEVGTYTVEITGETISELTPTITYSTDDISFSEYSEAFNIDILSNGSTLYISISYEETEEETE